MRLEADTSISFASQTKMMILPEDDIKSHTCHKKSKTLQKTFKMIFILVDIFIHLDKFLDVLGEDEIE